jgi:hypothetical protein
MAFLKAGCFGIAPNIQFERLAPSSANITSTLFGIKLKNL